MATPALGCNSVRCKGHGAVDIKAVKKKGHNVIPCWKLPLDYHSTRVDYYTVATYPLALMQCCILHPWSGVPVLDYQG
jgi:hypothetical protein